MVWSIRRPAKFLHNPMSTSSLRQRLLQPPILIENYKRQKFFCKAAVDKLLTRETILFWIKNHPLHRGSDIGAPSEDVHDKELVEYIIKNARLLFAILVAAELESFTYALVTNCQSDMSLPNIDSERFDMTSEERQRFIEACQKFSPVLSRSKHEDLSFETVLPFTQSKETGKKGAFGLIYRVEVADGHLEGYDQSIVAEKLVRPDNLEHAEICLREVDTLRQRKHPNIEPLLASYAKKTTDSDSVAPLHFIFPFADGGNLADCMESPQQPLWLRGCSRQKERAYLYHCIYALVSGLSFLHRENNGTITAHHDLKPSNILVFGQDLKIADFGRSHLHTLAQGSETHVNSGLGTYEYQPPEYWEDNGRHAMVKHGRAFDMWSMGCIIVELATLIVHGWQSEKVSEFRRQRRDNSDRKRPDLASQHHPDISFHNNWNVVKDWIRQLGVDDDRPKMTSTLGVALQMMNENREDRLYAWEAELDLYDIQYPDDDRSARLEKGDLCVQAPPPQEKLLDGTQTPLHRAAQKRDWTRFNQLCRAGWSASVKDKMGLTPSGILQQYQHAERPGCWPSLHTRPITTTPTKPVNERQGQELLWAAARGDLDKIRDLLAHEVDIMFVDKSNRSALYEAAKENQCDVAKFLLEDNGHELLRLKDMEWSETPLHKAAVNGHAEMIRLLLQWTPDIEDKQKLERTALFLAVECGHEKAVDVLLDHKAQVFTQGDSGGTPLHAAARKNNPRILKRLLNAPGAEKCLEHRNNPGDSPLWKALYHRNVECAEILFQRGASLHVWNKDNCNVVHLAVDNDLYDFLETHIQHFRKDDFESRDSRGHTPLGLAQNYRKQRFVELLMRYTARI